MKKKKKVRIGQVVLTISLGIGAIVCLMPMVLVIIVSFSSDESISAKGFSFAPLELSLKAWEYVFNYGEQLLTSYKVTLIVTVGSTVFGLLVMALFAYTLSRRCFMLRKFLSLFMLITMLFSGGQLATYIVETSLYGLKDNILALMLPGISTMNIIILRTYIQSNISESLIDSAKIDGAGEMRIFWRIVLPLMKPALASVAFMLAVTHWNEWQKAYLYITSPSKTPLQLLLIRIEKNIEYLLSNQDNVPAAEYLALADTLPKESGRMAILLTALGPIMIAYPFFQKYFVKGLTVGSVKG